jgi:hypothetical protein
MAFLRPAARILSLVFHPLWVLTAALLLFLLADPYAFGTNHISKRMPLLLATVGTTILIPGIAVVMMRFLGLVDDLEVRDRMQRVGPYLAAGIFYTWMTRNFLGNPDVPPLFGAVSLGCTLAIFLGFAVNVVFKVSLHAAGAAGMTAILLLLWLHVPSASVDLGLFRVGLATLLFLSVPVAGLVGSARLTLGVHRPSEIGWGYALGFACPFLGLRLAELIA